MSWTNCVLAGPDQMTLWALYGRSPPPLFYMEIEPSLPTCTTSEITCHDSFCLYLLFKQCCMAIPVFEAATFYRVTLHSAVCHCFLSSPAVVIFLNLCSPCRFHTLACSNYEIALSPVPQILAFVCRSENSVMKKGIVQAKL